jgi:virginiamycin A acetyltransferase
MNIPDKDKKFPLENYDRLCFLKNVVKNPNIIVGDYTYYDDFETVYSFPDWPGISISYLFHF